MGDLLPIDDEKKCQRHINVNELHVRSCLLQAISVLENEGTLFLRASRPDIVSYKYWWSPALIQSPQMDAIVDMTTINDTRLLALFVISAVSAPFSVITEKWM